MTTAAEIRWQNLRKLVAHFGSLAELNHQLHRERRDATLSQILNRSRDSKTGQPRQMGDKLARAIEAALGWERGRMDAPLAEPLFARAAEPVAAYEPSLKLSAQEKDLLLSYRMLPEEMRAELLIDVMHAAEEHAQLTRSLLERMHVTGIVSPDRAAEKLPPAPRSAVRAKVARKTRL